MEQQSGIDRCERTAVGLQPPTGENAEYSWGSMIATRTRPEANQSLPHRRGLICPREWAFDGSQIGSSA